MLVASCWSRSELTPHAPLPCPAPRRPNAGSSALPASLDVSVIESAFPPPGSSRALPAAMTTMLSGEPLALLRFFYSLGPHDCESDLPTPTFHRLMDPAAEDEYDVILFDHLLADCLLALAHRYDYPGVVAASPFPGAFWLDDLLGSPAAPGIRSLALSPFPHPMSLWQRAATAALHLYARYLQWRNEPEVQSRPKPSCTA